MSKDFSSTRRERILKAQSSLVEEIQYRFYRDSKLADRITQRQSDLIEKYGFTRDELIDSYGDSKGYLKALSHYPHQAY